jgi:hypothetical protein
MYLSTILVSLSLTIALAAPTRRAASCAQPTSWQINGLSAFTAAPGPDGISNIFFELVDSVTGVVTTCERALPPGSGRSPEDPDNYYPCNDTAVEYLFGTGNLLALKETFECNG